MAGKLKRQDASREQSLRGKRVLVTGAARRIGREIALGFARAGADVVITYLKSRSEADHTVADLHQLSGTARAIRCAEAISKGVRPLGIEVRAGLHTGECEVIGEKVGGIAVHIGARVASLARAGEVLVSNTVKDLVAGSGIAFEDRGTQTLKGVPGDWRLFADTPAG